MGRCGVISETEERLVSFDFTIFMEAVASWAFLRGALVTMALAIISHAVAMILGLGMALLANGSNKTGRKSVALYSWVVRATPLLLQLLFIWNAVPQIFPVFKESWFTPFMAAFIALSLHQTAYQTEILRSALRSVSGGQQDAAKALGLSRVKTLWLVTLPQAMRVALPPTGSEFISLVKTTSLATVISLKELMTTATYTISNNFRFLEIYGAALVYYLVIVSVLMIAQSRLELRLDAPYGR